MITDNRKTAIACILFSAVGFALMGATVKLSGDLPLHQKVFFRNLVTLAITGMIFLRRRENPLRKTPALHLLLMRSLIGLAGVFLYFYAIDNMNLADAAMLNKLSPFFVTILAALLLGEKIRRHTAPTLVGAFIGALLIIKPRFDLAMIPALAGAGSALCAGAAYTLVRAMKDLESAHRIVFFFSLVSTLVTGPLLLLRCDPATGSQTAALLGTGAFAAIGQFGLTWAFHRAPAAQISIYNYSHILFAGLVGFVIWNERPDAASILGGVLIVTMALISHRRDLVAANP